MGAGADRLHPITRLMGMTTRSGTPAAPGSALSTTCLKKNGTCTLSTYQTMDGLLQPMPDSQAMDGLLQPMPDSQPTDGLLQPMPDSETASFLCHCHIMYRLAQLHPTNADPIFDPCRPSPPLPPTFSEGHHHRCLPDNVVRSCHVAAPVERRALGPSRPRAVTTRRPLAPATPRCLLSWAAK